ncbi:hypothetical protein [Vogesella sp. XCS3]|uniref:hypothetical protein n=1 Tax=Vogesella sp. XCS3 TaxID=2877939 RepID=UPI001D0AC5F0|nr:hypothetical protein [Vogesella sp. XCS3]UDM15453.1 hypothetical protein LCH97_08935 [Vogesella sp. XCS3]
MLLPLRYPDLKATTMPPLRHLALAATLAAIALPVYAALPPAYLAVPDFKQCLAEQNEGSYRSWCQPSKKPKACPRVSWRQLRALQGHDAVPACRAK